ncbi:thiamine pyrophosphate-binding protein [Oceanibacterium hippocampi]|uniref:thiamine pyrophosphate-binding protein n=1 Tax=Oceanibacterium hippocampi TaxID=745714 RepID=UPI000A2715F7|nr:thiamine pyrophosphate-binding protein [Oceanibacterium hippocampi]
MPDVATLIARRLHAAGCRHAFGIPGGEVLAMMQALDDAGIAFTLCKHENSAAFMAEGSFHATGAPGILLATIGPGLANGVNAVANGWQDQVPLIVLSGAVDAVEAASYTHQVFDHQALMRPITKASLSMVDGAADLLIDRAVAIALADPPGPVHVDVPIGLAGHDQREPGRVAVPMEPPMAPAGGAALDQARAMLANAVRPLMIAGMGALHHDAGIEIRALVERFRMPLLTTYKAKGILPEDHELALGGHGLSPRSDREVMPLLEAADLILLAGYDPIEMRIGWRDPWDPAKAIEFTHVPNRHGMHGAALSFVGDVGRGIAAIGAGLEPGGETWPERAPAQARARLHGLFADRPAWGPHAAFAAARRAVPRDTVVTADSGAHRILLSQMWTCYAERTLLQSTALCTMGCALPLAIGHKLAAPDRPVLAVMGDAGLEMVLGELATLRDLELSLVVLVMVDASLALIELKQRGASRRNVGVDFGATDLAAVAAAMGGHGCRATDVATLERELAAGFRRDGFTLVACEIGARAYDDAF